MTQKIPLALSEDHPQSTRLTTFDIVLCNNPQDLLHEMRDAHILNYGGVLSSVDPSTAWDAEGDLYESVFYSFSSQANDETSYHSEMIENDVIRNALNALLASPLKGQKDSDSLILIINQTETERLSMIDEIIEILNSDDPHRPPDELLAFHATDKSRNTYMFYLLKEDDPSNIRIAVF